jgi:Tfp pilus assembly protein PilV
MTGGRLRNCAGFTIVEVLVAALVFVVGFSVLVNLLNSTLIKFSTEGITEASLLAHEIMTETTATEDTTSLDTLIRGSHLSWRVNRTVCVDSKLAQVTVSVYREKRDKKMIELYNAFILSER